MTITTNYSTPERALASAAAEHATTAANLAQALLATAAEGDVRQRIVDIIEHALEAAAYAREITMDAE